MYHITQYNKFVNEIERLIQIKDKYSENTTDFSVTLNMDVDIERKKIVNDIVKGIQSKSEKNMLVKFENLFRLYNVMEKYKKKYSNDNGKKVTKLLLNDITLEGKNKVIRKTIRIFHFFKCLESKGVSNAYKFCQISPRDFDSLSDEKWTVLAHNYQFENEYSIDYSYWRVRNRVRNREKNDKKESEDSDKTISDLDD